MTHQESSRAADSASGLIPVTLLTGFLGSGKTTVLNHLVRQPELSDALVIINEFGEMARDHMIVAHSTENMVMEMSSGCVCCTIRGDLGNGEIAAHKVLDLGLFTAAGKPPDVARWLREETYAAPAPHGQAHEHHDHDHEAHDHPGHDPNGHAQAHGQARDHHDVIRHDDHIRAFCFTVEQSIPEETLADWLDLLMSFVGSCCASDAATPCIPSETTPCRLPAPARETARADSQAVQAPKHPHRAADAASGDFHTDT